MSNYLSDLGNIPIIDPGNAHLYAEESADEGFSRGYVERDYHRFGEGFYAPRYSGPVFPRSQWDDLIQMHDENHSSPDHWRIKAGVPVLDQNGLGYCWIYGVAGAMMTGYTQTGISVPHLSATSAGAQGKNWRNEGGWAGEAIEYIARFGMAELSVWPEHSMDRSLPNQEASSKSTPARTSAAPCQSRLPAIYRIRFRSTLREQSSGRSSVGFCGEASISVHERKKPRQD